jgi:hypothetical protein
MRNVHSAYGITTRAMELSGDEPNGVPAVEVPAGSLVLIPGTLIRGEEPFEVTSPATFIKVWDGKRFRNVWTNSFTFMGTVTHEPISQARF